MSLTIALILILAEVLFTVVISHLNWKRIADWFLNREAAIETDDSKLRITLHEKMKSGQHRVVYGIFNSATEQFTDGEVVIADSIDEELMEHHKDMPLVVYK
jgi:hypothetical protein